MMWRSFVCWTSLGILGLGACGPVVIAEDRGVPCTDASCAPNEAAPISNVRVVMRDDTAVIDFHPVDGARDYRVFALPAQDDWYVDDEGVTVARNAVYRCAGTREREVREAPLSDEGTAGDTLGYARSDVEARLGYVSLTPGADRVAVYRVANPRVQHEFTNADWGLAPLIENNAADYVIGEAARDALLAQGWRDDGIAFYAPSAGAVQVFRGVYADSVYRAPKGLFFTAGPEHDFRVTHEGIESVEARFTVWSDPAPDRVPLWRVNYSLFDVLAAGEAAFLQVFSAGPVPMASVAWRGVREPMTLVVEALDAGCPFAEGYLSYAHWSNPADAYPMITLDEARHASTGEVFVNGQHAPTNRPKPIARVFVQVAPPPPSTMDFHESFNDVAPLTDLVALSYVSIFENDKWALYARGNPNPEQGAVLGELRVGCTDWGSSCDVALLPHAVPTSLTATGYVHARMSIGATTTIQRYPGVVITTLPYVPYGSRDDFEDGDYVIGERLGGAGHSSVLVQPINHELQIQFCDNQAWTFSGQCPKSNSHGRMIHWVNNAQPLLPTPPMGSLAGHDRPVRFDVYASTERVYTFVDDQPAGCAVLPAGRMPSGPVSVYFHVIGDHVDVDTPSTRPDIYPYLNAYSVPRTDRAFDEVGISNDVALPAWDDQRFPCGTEWQ